MTGEKHCKVNYIYLMPCQPLKWYQGHHALRSQCSWHLGSHTNDGVGVKRWHSLLEQLPMPAGLSSRDLWHNVTRENSLTVRYSLFSDLPWLGLPTSRLWQHLKWVNSKDTFKGKALQTGRLRKLTVAWLNYRVTFNFFEGKAFQTGRLRKLTVAWLNSRVTFDLFKGMAFWTDRL